MRRVCVACLPALPTPTRHLLINSAWSVGLHVVHACSCSCCCSHCRIHADVSAKLYRPSAYYVAKQLAVLPFAVLNALLFAFSLYGLAGLRHDATAVGMNGAMSVLIYLIAAQVSGRAAVAAQPTAHASSAVIHIQAFVRMHDST